MLKVQRFKLARPSLSLGANGERKSLIVPAGSVIKIVSQPKSEHDQMVDVLWNGKVVTMFALDILERQRLTSQ